MPHLHKFAVALIISAVVVGFLVPSERNGANAPRVRPAAGGGPARSAPAGAPGVAARRPPPKRARVVNRAKAAAAARAAGANELGQVPILMIHRVLAKPQVSMDRTPKELSDEFTQLARQNYVPVTAAEFVNGQMDIPAGKHPVVLTFDDGSVTQAAFDAGGNPKPDTAVGIIQHVARQNPGFRPVATFFVNKNPFAGGGMAPAAAIRWLTEHGFEVANHTANNQDLAKMNKDGVAKEIGTVEKMIADASGMPSATFAFPSGALSHLEWAQQGDMAGTKWDFKGMFLAGWRPADSPYEKDYNAQLIPRIRDKEKITEDDCAHYCSTAWLDWLAANPDKRYTSDGNPATIAFPRDKMIYLAPRYKDWACPY